MSQDLDYDPCMEDKDEDSVNVIPWHSSFSDAIIHSKTNRPKSDDPGWKYGFLEDRSCQNNVRCLLCAFLCKGGIGRLKGHLMGGDKNITKCPKVPAFISKEVSDYVRTKKVGIKRKGKEPVQIEETEVVDLEDPQQMREMKKKLVVTGIVSSSGSAALGPLQLKKDETVYDVIQRRKVDKQPSIADHVKKQEKKLVDYIVSGWFYSSAIPFHASTSLDFEASCEAIGRYGPSYKPPTMRQLRGSLLEEHVSNINGR